MSSTPHDAPGQTPAAPVKYESNKGCLQLTLLLLVAAAIMVGVIVLIAPTQH